jgi:uncharacterized RDD family membrane protein YckC
MGSVQLLPGAVVRRDVVAVMGDLSAAEGTTVGGNAVSVGGKLSVDNGAVVHGQRNAVGMPFPFGRFHHLGSWVTHCLFRLRPLSLQVGWIWPVAGLFFLLYLFIALAFPAPVQACVDRLTRQPATSFLIGLLTKLLFPIVVLILAVTVVGLIALPFLVIAMFIASVVGKVAILEWIGLKLSGRFHGGQGGRVLFFILGAAVITLLYLIPVVGFVAFAVFAVWGLGCAAAALFGSTRRESPEPVLPAPNLSGLPMPPPPSAGPAATPAPQVPAPGFVAGTQAAAASAPPSVFGPPSQSSPIGQPPPAPPLISPPAATIATPGLPKAGFWERMAAALVDVVLVGVLGIFIGGPPMALLIALAYFSAFWTWRGTTIGGIILKLHVVRSDGGPLTFPVALVRSLAAAFSAAFLFLGFFWIAWDKDKLGWHDKIAGTEVVRLPRSRPLL